jgi:hypothetical protein
MRNALVLASLLAACGGGVSSVNTPGTAQLSGKPGGEAFEPQGAFATFDSASSALIGLYLTQICGADAYPTSATSLRMSVQDASSGMPAVAGAYTIASGGARSANATYTTTGSSSIEATSGVVDITANKGGDLRGTFDLTFHDGSSASGSFDACESSQ